MASEENVYDCLVIGSGLELTLFSKLEKLYNFKIKKFLTKPIPTDLCSSLFLNSPSMTENLQKEFEFQSLPLREPVQENYFWAANRMITLSEKNKSELSKEEVFFISEPLWNVIWSPDSSIFSVQEAFHIKNIEFSRSKKPHHVFLNDGSEFFVKHIVFGSDLQSFVRLCPMDSLLVQKLREAYGKIALEIDFELEKNVGDYHEPLVVPNSQENLHPFFTIYFPKFSGMRGKHIKCLAFLNDEEFQDRNEVSKRIKHIRRQVQKIFSTELKHEKIFVHENPMYTQTINPKVLKSFEKELPPDVYFLGIAEQHNFIQAIIGNVDNVIKNIGSSLNQAPQVSQEISQSL